MWGRLQWGEDIRKGCRRVNIVEILIHMHVNGKMRPVETIQGMRGREIKENDGGGELNYDVL
jgi:hypothetical protein